MSIAKGRAKGIFGATLPTELTLVAISIAEVISIPYAIKLATMVL